MILAPHACPAPSTLSGEAYFDASDCAGITTSHTLSAGSLMLGIGNAFGDYDNDGWVDLYVTDEYGPNTLYRNRGDGSFELSPYSPIVAVPDASSSGAVFADYDNDGWEDLYVVTRSRNRLFKNQGGVGFTEVAELAGVADLGQGASASFGDYDKDGYLDLYVANWLCNCEEPADGTDRLYHNEGDGTFSDAGALLERSPAIPGPTLNGAGFIASFVDYNDDGWPDLYLANDKGGAGPPPNGLTNRNVLWENQGPGCGGHCFVEVGPLLGADVRADSMGLAIGDYDNDGDLDMHVTDTSLRSHLLRNDKQQFSDVGPSVGVSLEAPSDTWGTAFFDFDNDGWKDLYICADFAPNFLFRNLGDGTFENVSSGSGVDDSRESLGAAYADYDHDGRIDVVVGNRGLDYRLYRNVGVEAAAQHWLSLRLVGGGMNNRNGVGGRVYVVDTNGLTQMQEVKCGSSLGAGNDLALHFGLGEAEIDHVRVVWPDGTEHTLWNVGIDAGWRVVHPDAFTP